MNNEIREIIELLLGEVYDAESFMETFESSDDEHIERVNAKRDIIEKAEKLLEKYNE